MDWEKMYAEKIVRAGGVEGCLKKKEGRSAGALIKRIRKNFKRGSRILEVGTGTGAIGALLTKYGFDVTVVDNDKNMVKIAKQTLSLFNKTDRVRLVDAKNLINEFGLNSFDCVISHGMLEHYSDIEILTFLRVQLLIAPSVVFVIPTDFVSEDFRSRGFGDERYLSTKHWKKLVENSFFVQSIFGFGLKETGLPRFLEILLKSETISSLIAPWCGINEFWITSRIK